MPQQARQDAVRADDDHVRAMIKRLFNWRSLTDRCVSAGLLAAALLAGQPAHACTMGTQVIHAYIDERSAKIERVVSSRYVTRRAYEQVVKLKSGMTVKFSVGGCDHFGIRLAFSPIAKLARDTPPPDLVRIARESLSALPIRKADEAWLFDLKISLASQAAALDMQPLASGYSFACGEFKTCELIVPRPGVLEVSYSFAL